MVCAHLVGLPVHPRGVAVIHLHPVDADVPYARHRVFADHQGQRDERASIVRPAGERWQRREVDVVASDHDLLTRSALHRLGLERCDVRKLSQGTELGHQTLVWLLHHAQQIPDAFRQFVQAFHAKRPRRALNGAEGVDEQGHGVAFNILK